MIALRRADRWVWACAAMALGASGCPAKIQVGAVLETAGGLTDGGDAGDSGADAGDAGPDAGADAGDAGPDGGFCFIGDLVVPSGAVSDAGCCNPALSGISWSSLFVAGGTYWLHRSGSDIVAADFNQDGIPDIAICSPSDSCVWVFFGTGDGGLSAPSKFPTDGGSATWCDVSAGDLNGDNFPDLVLALDNKFVGVMLNEGGAAFSTQVNYQTRSKALRVAVGDMDGDGSPDVVCGEADGTVGVFLNVDGGQGVLGTERAFASGASTTWETHVGDFNGDGHLDTAITDGTSSAVILLNDGGAGLTTSFRDTLLDHPSSMAVGRLFSDSSDDLVVGSEAIAKTTVLSVSDAGLNDRSDAVTVVFGTLMAADFNGDKRLDIVAGSWSEYVVLFNQPDGTFSAPIRTVYPSQYNIQDIAVGDFNGDGAPDLAILESAGNLTIWYYACPAPPQ